MNGLSSPRVTFKLDAADFAVAAISILDLFSYVLFDIKCGLVRNDDPCRHAGNARLPCPPAKGARFQLVDSRAAGAPTLDGLDPVNFLACLQGGLGSSDRVDGRCGHGIFIQP